MQPPPGSSAAMQLKAPPARDPVTKLQILLGNLLKHFTDVVVHLSEVAPPRSVSGAVDASGAVDPPGSSNACIKSSMTQEQLNEFIVTCSRGVGSLVHLIEEEAEKLPDAIRSQEEIQSELQYLEEENARAAKELKQLVSAVRHVREGVREAYRVAATDGTHITID